GPPTRSHRPGTGAGPETSERPYDDDDDDPGREEDGVDDDDPVREPHELAARARRVERPGRMPFDGIEEAGDASEYSERKKGKIFIVPRCDADDRNNHACNKSSGKRQYLQSPFHVFYPC